MGWGGAEGLAERLGEQPYPCGTPGPGGLKGCLHLVQDSASWVSDGHENTLHQHIWWAQEGSKVFIYFENPLERFPDLRYILHIDTAARITQEQAAELLARRDRAVHVWKNGFK